MLLAVMNFWTAITSKIEKLNLQNDNKNPIPFDELQQLHIYRLSTVENM